MKISFLVTLFFAFTLIAKPNANAQFSNSFALWSADWDQMARIYKGLEVGINTGFAGNVTFKSTHFLGGREIVQYEDATSSPMYGLYFGYGTRIAKLSHNQALGIGVGATINFLTFKPESGIRYFGDTASSHYKIQTTKYSYVGIPISLDYKSGAEAAWDRDEGNMFAIGAGICPKIIATGYFNEVSWLSVTPFAKAEFGFFAGLAMKLRATYFIGEQVYANDNPYYAVGYYSGQAAPDFDATLKVSTGGELVISLLIMPFSRSWGY